jgi:hypothetical protein
MQLHGQATETATALGFVGAELLTALQVLFCVLLGYAITRAWILFRPRPRTLQVSTKKLDDVDVAVVEDTCNRCGEEPPSPARTTLKSRHSNAQERKRMRKVSQSEIKEKKNCLPHVATEVKVPCELSQEVVEIEVAVEHAKDDTAVNVRVSKLMAKKADRKARKAQLQKNVVEHVEAQDADFPVNNEKSDSESLSQDGQTDISQSASTPSMASAAGGGVWPSSSESDIGTSPGGMEGHDCSTPDSARSQKTLEDDGAHSGEADVSPIEVDPKDELRDICALTNDVPQLHTCGFDLQPEEAAPNNVKLSDTPVSTNLSYVNFDAIESDTDSDIGCEGYSREHVLARTDIQPANEVSNAPVMWCSPGIVDENSPMNWVAVAVPTECAPPGAFDGLWKSSSDEKILIERLEIMFESGVAWNMEMHSLTSISVEVGGQKIYAELDGNGEKLLWSDGDVWTFFGQVDDPPQQCATQAVPELPCMMMPFIPEGAAVEDVPMPPQNQWIPRSVDTWEPVQRPETWELCWDWEKKGRCPRGVNCEWYHPMPESYFY